MRRRGFYLQPSLSVLLPLTEVFAIFTIWENCWILWNSSVVSFFFFLTVLQKHRQCLFVLQIASFTHVTLCLYQTKTKVIIGKKKKKTSIDLFALTSPCASWDVLTQHFWASGPKYHCVRVPYQLTLRRLKYSEISKMPLNSSIYLNCTQNLRL